MHTFIRRSIQRQLTAIGLLASLGGLLVAANATVALSFASAADATENLGTLRAESSIVSSGQETDERSAPAPDHLGTEASAPISTACAPSQGQAGARRS